MIKKKSIEFNIDEIIVALCYNLGMIKEDNILISKLKLSDLRELAETYFKLSKSENKDVKERAEKRLIETLNSMEKAHKEEIMTVSQYSRKFLGLLGGRDKAIELIENAKRRKDELSKRPKRTKSDN